jgi:hypothetical protein
MGDPDLRECDAADGYADSVRQYFALDLDHPAQPSDDARARLQQLIRPSARGELERSYGCDMQLRRRTELLWATNCREPSGLRQKLDQHNRRHDWVGRKMALKVPILWVCDAETARRLAWDEISDLLHEPHRRPMRQQVDSKRP